MVHFAPTILLFSLEFGFLFVITFWYYAMTTPSKSNSIVASQRDGRSVESGSLSFFKQDRFQVAVCLALAVYKARISFTNEAALSSISVGMDLVALFIMYLMHKETMSLSVASLLIFTAVNSLKFVTDSSHDWFHILVAAFAASLICLSSRSLLLTIIAFVPTFAAHFGFLPSPFALTYLLDATVGLPMLFQTLPNQFGEKRQVNALACHALLFVIFGRIFLTGHYLELGILRKFSGPWDVPLILRGRDCFAAAARSIGFFLHLLQAGFFAKFMLYYIPAFCSTSSFRMPDVGCRLKIFEARSSKTNTSVLASHHAVSVSSSVPASIAAPAR